jgi:hypothetical protein
MSTVLTGSDGALSFNGTLLGKVKNWKLNRTRDRLDNTTLDLWDETWVPGRRSGVATATILYDENELDTEGILDAVLVNKPGKSLVTLYLESPDTSYDLPVYVESVGSSVNVGDASVVEANFRLTSADYALTIFGPTSVLQDETRYYTAEVVGFPGAWNYLWEAVAGQPEIETPFEQNTNVTFPAAGTARLKVTATLGNIILTDFIDIVVGVNPPLWSNSMMTAITRYLVQGLGQTYYITNSVMDPAGSVFFSEPFEEPVNNVIVTHVAKFNKAGTLLWNKRITFNGSIDPGLFSLSMTSDQTGGIFYLAGCQTSGTGNIGSIYIIRLDANGDKVWATKINQQIPFIINSLYVPEHNALYFCCSEYLGGNRHIMSVNANNGNIVSDFIIGNSFSLVSSNIVGIAYNPFRNTIVVSVEEDSEKLALFEGNSYFLSGGGTDISVTKYLYTGFNTSGGQNSGRNLAFNSTGYSIMSTQTGLLRLDPTYNPVRSIVLPAGVDGIPTYSSGGTFFPDGTYLYTGSASGQNAFSQHYSADLSQLLQNTVASVPSGSFPSARPGDQTGRIGIGVPGNTVPGPYGPIFFRTFPPEGPQSIDTRRGDTSVGNKATLTRSTTVVQTTQEQVPSKSVVSPSFDKESVDYGGASGLSVADELYATDWHYTSDF